MYKFCDEEEEDVTISCDLKRATIKVQTVRWNMVQDGDAQGLDSVFRLCPVHKASEKCMRRELTDR